MNRSEYTQRVLSQLKRLTRAETESIRAEIDGHMEDCYLAMLDLGYPEEVAEERTLSRMGDPEEVGKALDKQYPLRWLVIGDIAAFLLVILALMSLLVLFGHDRSPIDALRCRIQPEPYPLAEVTEAEASLDKEFPLGNDIVRVFRVSIGQVQGTRMAVVDADAFDRLPLGPTGRWLRYMELENQSGETGEGYGGAMDAPFRRRDCYDWFLQQVYAVPIDADDTYVTLRCERFGETLEYQIPLPKEGTP